MSNYPTVYMLNAHTEYSPRLYILLSLCHQKFPDQDFVLGLNSLCQANFKMLVGYIEVKILSIKDMLMNKFEGR